MLVSCYKQQIRIISSNIYKNIGAISLLLQNFLHYIHLPANLLLPALRSEIRLMAVLLGKSLKC